MDISKDAKARLENRVTRIVGDIDIYEADKQDIVRELTSHFYDSSMMRAQSRGSKTIEKDDVEATLADSEDPKEIAAAYMKTYVDSLGRAGIISRSVAFIIDLILALVATVIVVALLSLPLLPFFPGAIVVETLANGELNLTFASDLAGMVFTIIWGLGSLVTMICYFVVLEGRFGYTPGKWLLGLRVLKDDGTRIGYVESLLRNLPKLLGSFSLLVLDALLMIILFRKDRQRGFDKIARTIVVHKNKKEEK
ncbi:RDD family protein [Methanocella sp. MCL-LM]|uniref:RDD family protein n=1 Tax=Methanocella sp. MCL-LM TaxID=3412035 RepID=UPI003C79605A